MSDGENWKLATGFKTPEECNAALLAQHEEIRRLKAEIDRLTPSGQVAEDEAHLQRVLADPLFKRQTGPEFRTLLERLAAGAQGYEAMKAERDEWRRKAMDVEAHPAVVALRAERDTAAAKATALSQELNGHIRAGCQTAEILAGSSSMLGEGIVAGAQRVVAERDLALQHVAQLLQVARAVESALADVAENGDGADCMLTTQARARELLAIIRAPHPATAEELGSAVDQFYFRGVNDGVEMVATHYDARALQALAAGRGAEGEPIAVWWREVHRGHEAQAAIIRSMKQPYQKQDKEKP